ncbi:hypothetical protein BH10BDE1_BH10BDE1_26670 [soil metagenome]
MRLHVLTNSIFSLLILPMIAACSNPASSVDGSGARGDALAVLIAPSQAQIAVVDSANQPIAGARVLIGKTVGVPFAGNVVETDSGGVALRPSAWTNEQPVTIEAPGFIRATFFSRKSETAVFQLRRSPKSTPLQLQGKTTGFGTLTSNGVLDVSLVYPAVPRSQAASLELTQLIGTGVDKVSVYGETLELPSNLAVPNQTETYFMIVPVTLNKPTYRLSVPEAGDYRFAAVRAQFNFKQTIDDLRAGKSFFDLINRLQFRSYSTRDFGIRLPVQSADLPLGEIPLKATLAVQAVNVPKGYAMVATAMVENDGLCVVTDVKRLLDQEKRTLMSSAKGNAVLVRTLKKFDEKRTDFSGSDYEEMSAIVSAGASTSSDFLPILNPIGTRARSLLLSPPRVASSLRPSVTQVTLSRVEVIGSGGLWLVSKTPLWDLYGEGFMGEMELPSLGADVWASKGRYRWELRYGAKPVADASAVELSVNALGPMSHVTKTAVDFLVP